MENFTKIKLSADDIKTIRYVANEWYLDFETVGFGKAFEFLKTIAESSDTEKWDMNAFRFFVRKKSAHFMKEIRIEAKMVMKILHENGIA